MGLAFVSNLIDDYVGDQSMEWRRRFAFFPRRVKRISKKGVVYTSLAWLQRFEWRDTSLDPDDPHVEHRLAGSSHSIRVDPWTCETPIFATFWVITVMVGLKYVI